MTNHPIERETHPLLRTAALKLLLPIAKIDRDVRVSELTEDELISLARSVLETVRELTPDVVEAGVEYWHTHEQFLDDEVRGQFTAMLNTIIGERG